MNAETRINLKQDQIRYKKVGRKYVQCNDPYAYDGLREGWWLVKVAPGSTSIRQVVYPHTAELQAAIKDKEDKLVNIIRECTEARPKEGLPLSDQAKKDWLHFIDKHGKEFNMLYYPSFQESAEKIIAALMESK